MSGTVTIPMSGGWYMVSPMTRSMAELAHSTLDADEYRELDAAGVDRDGFIRMCMEGDHTCAVFAGADLVFVAMANWIKYDGRRERLWDTMSTRYVRERGHVMSFVKHTREMIDTFMAGEPEGVESVIGICMSDFGRSRKWIERVAKFVEIGNCDVNNHWFTTYRFTREDKSEAEGGK